MDWVFGGVHRKQSECQSFNRQDLHTGSIPMEGEERSGMRRLKLSFRAAHCGCHPRELKSKISLRHALEGQGAQPVMFPHCQSLGAGCVRKGLLLGKQLSVTETTAKGGDRKSLGY